MYKKKKKRSLQTDSDRSLKVWLEVGRLFELLKKHQPDSWEEWCDSLLKPNKNELKVQSNFQSEY